jgi:hypothetical protein
MPPKSRAGSGLDGLRRARREPGKGLCGKLLGGHYEYIVLEGRPALRVQGRLRPQLDGPRRVEGRGNLLGAGLQVGQRPETSPL